MKSKLGLSVLIVSLFISLLNASEKIGNLDLVDFETLSKKEFYAQKLILLIILNEKESLNQLELINEISTSTQKINEETSDTQIEAYAVKNSQFNKKFSILKFPQIFFYRNGNYLIYKDELNPAKITEWIEETREKKTHVLTDDTFEHDTQASTGSTTGDWFVLFHKTDCQTKSFIEPNWELAAIRLSNVVNFAYVDITENIKIQERFHIFNSPTVLFFRGGVMYRYELGKFDVDSLISFSSKGFYKNIKAEKIPLDKTWFDKTTDLIAKFIKEKAATNPNALIFAWVLSTLVFLIIIHMFTRKKDQPKQRDLIKDD